MPSIEDFKKNLTASKTSYKNALKERISAVKNAYAEISDFVFAYHLGSHDMKLGQHRLTCNREHCLLDGEYLNAIHMHEFEAAFEEIAAAFVHWLVLESGRLNMKTIELHNKRVEFNKVAAKWGVV